jgi:hypothetical protein
MKNEIGLLTSLQKLFNCGRECVLYRDIIWVNRTIVLANISMIGIYILNFLMFVSYSWFSGSLFSRTRLPT